MSEKTEEVKKMSAPVNVWQYARWTYIVGRSLRINPASRNEAAAVGVFIQQIKATRPWLLYRLQNKAEQLVDGGDRIIALQPNYAEAKMVMVIGRDLKKIPMTIIEKGYVETLLTATGTRYLGSKGGPAGDVH